MLAEKQRFITEIPLFLLIFKKLMQRTVVYLNLLLLLLLSTSCKTLIEEEFDLFEEKPVINCVIVSDSSFKVSVSLSGNLSDVAYKYVSDAEVIIMDSENIADTLTYSEEGVYLSNNVAQLNKRYFCKVLVPGFEEITSQAMVPAPCNISNVVFEKNAGRGEEGELISSVEFDIDEIPCELRYWEVNLIERGIFSEYDFKLNKVVTANKTVFHTIYLNPNEVEILEQETPPYNVFSNRNQNRPLFHVKFYFNEFSVDLNSDRDFFIELRNVEESYYKFQKQYYLYEMAANVGLGNSNTNYPLYSNIENGLGIFTAYSATYALVILK